MNQKSSKKKAGKKSASNTQATKKTAPKKATSSPNSLDELIKRTAKQSGMPEDVTARFIHELFEATADALETEERVSLYGLGIFKKKHQDTRRGFNPGTGEEIEIQEHERISFTPAKNFADTVNKKYRKLTPNVLDEMGRMVGLADKNEPPPSASADRSTAIRRAKITLVALLAALLLFIATVILVPAYFTRSDHRAVAYVRQVNSMMGLENVSASISRSTEESINRTLLKEYIGKTGSLLSENRKIIANHTVKPGDTIYNVAKKYYGNRHYWPYLYYQNRSEFQDPDLIRGGEELVVYESPGDPDSLTDKQKRDLAEAYITMYRIQRTLGMEEIRSGEKPEGKERIRESRWTLYSALRYDHDLLQTYEDAIYPEDRKIVDGFIDEFGYGDGTERGFWDEWF